MPPLSTIWKSWSMSGFLLALIGLLASSLVGRSLQTVVTLPIFYDPVVIPALCSYCVLVCLAPAVPHLEYGNPVLWRVRLIRVLLTIALALVTVVLTGLGQNSASSGSLSFLVATGLVLLLSCLWSPAVARLVLAGRTVVSTILLPQRDAPASLWLWEYSSNSVLIGLSILLLLTGASVYALRGLQGRGVLAR